MSDDIVDVFGLREKVMKRLGERGRSPHDVGWTLGGGTGYSMFVRMPSDEVIIVTFNTSEKGSYIYAKPANFVSPHQEYILETYDIDPEKLDLDDDTITIDHLCDQVLSLCLKKPKLV